ncbi:phenoxazinone synthase [Streptomyces sp. Ru87]|nr:phenoxazinone synthase [Streptomyces sp. Ru87]
MAFAGGTDVHEEQAAAGARRAADAAPAGGLTPYLDPLRVPPTVRPRPAAGGGPDEIEVGLRATWVRMHSQMPPTLVWAYDGHYPGPTFEVESGQRIRVAWANRITGRYPVTAGDAPLLADGVPSSAVPGRGADFTEEKDVADLPAWTVTHLHGAATGGGNDGWAENAVGYGETQLSEYPNEHRATAWWYHDHAMNITRWNVYAGLAGSYLIRDDEERALNLPRGEHEIPLTLSDRNFEVDPEGRPTGELLHKVRRLPTPNEESGEFVTLPFTGPYTLVNGVVWPHLDVEARWYRFRLLNASNARIFDLVLIDEDGRPVTDAIQQIGSDGGLLPRPVPVDFGDALPRLRVAPAERMDLLVDFRALRGKRVRLVNAPAGTVPGEPAGDVPFPQVMEFRVGRLPVRDRFVLPGVVSPSFRRLSHNTPHGHRLIVLTPTQTRGGRGHAEIWEMAEVTDGSVQPPADGVIQVTDDKGTTRTYRRISRTFDDALGIKVHHGDHEQWSFLNLSGIEHPMHIHLTDFQLMGRDPYLVDGFDPALGGTRSPVAYNTDPAAAIPLAPNEQAWKDVYRVPGPQMLRVMARLAGAHGRFMYHCHLLEHEDMGMMRPFTVMPPEVMKFDHGQPGHGGH